MSNLLFTTLVNYTFNYPNENPLNPAYWTFDTEGDDGLQIVNRVCQPQTLSSCGEIYTGIKWPSNQWVSIRVLTLSDPYADASIFVRTNLDISTGYYLNISAAGNGPLPCYGTLTLYSVVSGDTLFAINSYIDVGDVFLLGALNTTLYTYYNGALLNSVVDDTTPSGGSVSLALSAATSTANCQVVDFSGGLLSEGLVYGFEPNFYYGEGTAGLSIYISPGSINGTEIVGQVVSVSPNTTTNLSVDVNGKIQPYLSGNLYPIATVVSGQVPTSGTKGLAAKDSNGILSITDIRPTTPFSF